MSRGKCWSSRKRRQLWNRNHRCFWCGCATVLGGKLSADNLATIDHLRPRHDDTRREPCAPNEIRLVLACRACNNARDAGELAAMPREVFYAKGLGTPPLSYKSDEEVAQALAAIEQSIARTPPDHKNQRNLAERKECVMNELRRRSCAH